MFDAENSEKMSLEELRERFLKMPTTVVSDALDAIGITNNAVTGIKPVWKCPAIFGTALTVRNVPASTHTQKNHGGFVTAQHAKPGDIIVVDNGGDTENNGWGELVAWAARMKGVVGTVVDGAVRDVDAFEAMGYPVYSKAITLRTARKRMIQDGINVNIRFRNTQVRPGDYIMADVNGICVIPPERVLEVLEKAELIQKKEDEMIEKIKKGENALNVQEKSGYEDMLNK
jgi:4-hydroxy-4-methyl-2-oxoglutarate aldolase